MNDIIIITFEDALQNIMNASTATWLYLPKGNAWSLNSKSALLQSEEVPPELENDPEAGVPELARQHSLVQALPVATVQDIVANARIQNANATIEDLFKAFMFYYKHDAFIELANRPRQK